MRGARCLTWGCCIFVSRCLPFMFAIPDTDRPLGNCHYKASRETICHYNSETVTSFNPGRRRRPVPRHVCRISQHCEIEVGSCCGDQRPCSTSAHGAQCPNSIKVANTARGSARPRRKGRQGNANAVCCGSAPQRRPVVRCSSGLGDLIGQSVLS